MSNLNAIKYEQVKKYPLSVMLAVDHEILHNRLRHWFVCLLVCLMVVNATFNNISAISWRTRRKPPTCRKSLTSLSHEAVHVHLALLEIRTNHISVDRH